jgi:hypothetical protein
MQTPTLIDDPTRASRYLADQLSEAECAAYEADFIQDPEAVAEIEATARLKIGLQRLRQSGELGELVAEPAHRSISHTLVMALAAGIAAIVIGVSVWMLRSAGPAAPVLASTVGAFRDHNGHSLSVLATTPLFRTRAESYDAVVTLPPSRGAIKLRVLPTNQVEAARYQASLSRIKADDSVEKIISIGNLQPSAEDGFVDLYADSSLLAPGRYRLILTREAGGAATSESDSFVIKIAAGAQ